MKSAFELAMERFGGPAKSYSDSQKQQLADVDKDIDAKIAQLKLTSRPADNETPEQREQREQSLVSEIRRLEAKREERKEALRRSFGNA
ncbi:MAG: hypothetical protein ACI4WT_14005 [Oligosphaeraceae bacterium]